jgi:hypothetical protein
MARRLYAFRRAFRIERRPNPHPVWWNGRGPDPEPELRHSHDTLIEVTPAELREDAAQHGPRLTYLRPCDAHRAHRWVKDGGHHATGLWTDNGRIRYASGEEGC